MSASPTRAHRRRRSSVLAAVLALGVLIAGCGGGDETSDEPPSAAPTDAPSPTGQPALVPGLEEPVILASGDGVIQLEVPAGMRVAEADLAVERVDPDTLIGYEDARVVAAYRLHPVDLAFPGGLVISLSHPYEQDPTAARLPLYSTVVQFGDSIVQTSGQTTRADGDSHLLHLTTIDSFGTLVLIDLGVTFALEPRRATLDSPSDAVVARLTGVVHDPSAAESAPSQGLELRWEQSGALGVERTEPAAAPDVSAGEPLEVERELVCDEVGSGAYRVDIGVDVTLPIGESVDRQFVSLAGEVSCGDVGRD